MEAQRIAAKAKRLSKEYRNRNIQRALCTLPRQLHNRGNNWVNFKLNYKDNDNFYKSTTSMIILPVVPRTNVQQIHRLRMEFGMNQLSYSPCAAAHRHLMMITDDGQ